MGLKNKIKKLHPAKTALITAGVLVVTTSCALGVSTSVDLNDKQNELNAIYDDIRESEQFIKYVNERQNAYYDAYREGMLSEGEYLLKINNITSNNEIYKSREQLASGETVEQIDELKSKIDSNPGAGVAHLGAFGGAAIGGVLIGVGMMFDNQNKDFNEETTM